MINRLLVVAAATFITLPAFAQDLQIRYANADSETLYETEMEMTDRGTLRLANQLIEGGGGCLKCEHEYNPIRTERACFSMIQAVKHQQRDIVRPERDEMLFRELIEGDKFEIKLRGLLYQAELMCSGQIGGGGGGAERGGRPDNAASQTAIEIHNGFTQHDSNGQEELHENSP